MLVSNVMHQQQLLFLAALLPLFMGVALGDIPDGFELDKAGTAILTKYCKKCHGDDDAYPGLDVADRNGLLDPIIENEDPFIVPGNAENSRIWEVITDDYMPPEDQPQLSSSDKEILSKWIDSGANFPPEEREIREYIGESTVLKMISRDIDRLTNDELAHTRYFSLVHLWNNISGEDPTTEEDLRMLRAAVSKLLNSLSNRPRIARPRIVDKKFGTLLAIDIRKIGWKSGDWQALLRAYPYALKVPVREYDILVRQTETRVPFVRADWFINTASRPPLYHDLLDIPANAEELERRLGVNIRENFQTGQLIRAAFQESLISDQNRMVERHDPTGGGRYYWKSYDIKPNAGVEGDFTRRPLGPVFNGNRGQAGAFIHDGGEIIFGLSNGLQGYMLVDGKDGRIDTGPPDVVSDKNRFGGNNLIANGISCMGCHKHGMIPWVKDDIRPLFLNRQNQYIGEQVIKLFPPDDQAQKVVTQDKQHFLRALEQSIGPFIRSKDQSNAPIESFPDPITKSARAYFRELGPETAAVELGITLEKLKAIASLPRFRDLGIGNFANGGKISRENWERVYGRVARELGLGVPIRSF